jgi:predicted ABC-type ATPase
MNPPNLVIVAGPNGSGKTTIMRWLRDTGTDLGTYINADDIAAGMPESPDRDKLAQQWAADERLRCVCEQISFTFETVMSHESRIDELKVARAAGFRIMLVFVGTADASINLDRVAQRVEEGGHDVPADRIVARYGRTMSLLPRAVAQAHKSLIFDNSMPRLGHQLACVIIERPDGTKKVKRLAQVAWVERYLLGELQNKI